MRRFHSLPDPFPERLLYGFRRLAFLEACSYLAELLTVARLRFPALIAHHARRHGVAYLLDQVYVQPHPKELMLRNHV